MAGSNSGSVCISHNVHWDLVRTSLLKQKKATVAPRCFVMTVEVLRKGKEDGYLFFYVCYVFLCLPMSAHACLCLFMRVLSTFFRHCHPSSVLMARDQTTKSRNGHKKEQHEDCGCPTTALQANLTKQRTPQPQTQPLNLTRPRKPCHPPGLERKKVVQKYKRKEGRRGGREGRGDTVCVLLDL